MKRDIELLRKLLLKIEQEGTANGVIVVNDGWIEGHGKDVVLYHLIILHESGLLLGQNMTSPESIYFAPARLSWEGHEAIADLSSDQVWQKVRERFKKLAGEPSLYMARRIAQSIISEQACE